MLIGRGTAIGLFQTYYEKYPLSSYTASEVSWIPSLQIFFMFAGVSDQFSEGLQRWLTV